MHVSSFSPFGHSFLSFPFSLPSLTSSPPLFFLPLLLPSPLPPLPPSLLYHIPSHLPFSFPAGPGVMETRGMTRELLSSWVTLPVYRDTILLNRLEKGEEGERGERVGGGGGGRGGRGGGGGGGYGEKIRFNAESCRSIQSVK